MSLAEELLGLHNSDEYPMHMPGHKRMDMGVLSESYHLDITEIEGYDNLYDAQGILKTAMENAAKVYGCKDTYFLVNGSTTGILTAICAVANRGKRIIAASNCHRSVKNAIELMNLNSEYLNIDYVLAKSIAGGISVGELEEKIKLFNDNNEEICAVVVTSPSYDGIVSNIPDTVRICHRYNIPLIVDEAHGAHFSMDERLPESALKYGADVVIHSTHKTLAAMTQTALLHVQGSLVDRRRVEKYWSTFQTSSPSYVLMASIDSALRQIQENGKDLWDVFFDNKKIFLEKTKLLNNLHILSTEDIANEENMVALDPCKVTVVVKSDAINGTGLQKILLEQYHIQIELANEEKVIAIVTYADSKDGFDRFAKALQEIDKKIDAGGIIENGNTQASSAIDEKKHLYAPCIT